MGCSASPFQPLAETTSMPSIDASSAIRVCVLGEWIPAQLAEVLALQRAEEPETAIVLTGGTVANPLQCPPSEHCDFVISTAIRQWSGWGCEPLWHDALAVAVTKRSHLLAFREIPWQEALKQPFVAAQSVTHEGWWPDVEHVLTNARNEHTQTVASMDLAMTLVAAGYGITIAPGARLSSYLHRGITLRRLSGASPTTTAYLLRPDEPLTESHARFAQRIRSVA